MSKLFKNDDFFGSESEQDDVNIVLDLEIKSRKEDLPINNIYTKISELHITKPSKVPKEVIRENWAEIDQLDISNFSELIPDPAVTYPFELDDFQKKAIYRVQNKQNCFVAAHTSAGKTVVAEYAIALALKEGKRAIYTSPIKALSNQKYRDFVEKFPSVGIVTGDVKVNPDAQCLIMTTEILRSYLYRGDDIISSIGAVIFDEVHYVNDMERGVVWEETIILLPKEVTLVMLSATVPNFLEFGDWVGRTKKSVVYCTFTSFRPTPLRFWLRFEDKTYAIDTNRKVDLRTAIQQCYGKVFAEKKAIQVAKEAAQAKSKAKAKPKAAASTSSGAKKLTADQIQRTEQLRLQSLIRELDSEDKLPCVCFVFSRLKCEILPTEMTKLDVLEGKHDKSAIHRFVKSALSNLSEEDQKLPQITAIVQLMERGLGVHHGGLLPIVKEMVELAFSQGLIKVLFATETFAMGINMPARSVIFTSVRKHDGSAFRYLLPQEFTQMAGRAGRRGLDDFGHVFIFAPIELPDQSLLCGSVAERADPLSSKFRLSFATLLQLCRSQIGADVLVTDILAKSFREIARAKINPKLELALEKKREELANLPEVMCILGTPDIEDYGRNEIAARSATSDVYRYLWKEMGEKERIKLFDIGRACMMHAIPGVSPVPFTAILLSRGEISTSANKLHMKREKHYDSTLNLTIMTGPVKVEYAKQLLDPVFDILALIPRQPLPVEGEDINGVLLSGNLPPLINTSYTIAPQSQSFAVLKGIPLWRISWMSTLELPYIPACLEVKSNTNPPNISSSFVTANQDQIMSAALSIQSNISSQMYLTPPPIALLTGKILSSSVSSLPLELSIAQTNQIQSLSKASSSKCATCILRDEHLATEDAKIKGREAIEDWEFRLTDASLELLPMYENRKEVLNILGFIQLSDDLQDSGIVTMKGRVACECVGSDEITLVEIIFRNILKGLNTSQTAAILSCFVCNESGGDDCNDLSDVKLLDALDQLANVHEEIRKLLEDHHALNIDFDWNSIVGYGFVNVVYYWATGTSFGDIMKLTALQEGTIVRSIIRLEELCRKIAKGAEIIGDPSLKSRMDEISSAIKRDIVFAPSLYFQNQSQGGNVSFNSIINKNTNDVLADKK